MATSRVSTLLNDIARLPYWLSHTYLKQLLLNMDDDADVLFENTRYTRDTVSDLLSDTLLNYTVGAKNYVAAGYIVQGGGFPYEVAAADASDHQRITAGGVKLYVRQSGGVYHVDAWGPDGTAEGDTAAIQEAFTYNGLNGGTLRFTSGKTYYIHYDEDVTIDPLKQAALYHIATGRSILPPRIIDFNGAFFEVTGTGSGIVAYGSQPFGGLGERGAIMRFHEPGNNAKDTNLSLKGPGFFNMNATVDFIAGIFADDCGRLQAYDLNFMQFTPDSDHVYGLVTRILYTYCERQNIQRILAQGGAGTWQCRSAASSGVVPITHVDYNGVTQTAGTEWDDYGSSSYARCEIRDLYGSGGKTAYYASVRGSIYDGGLHGVHTNNGEQAIVELNSDALGGCVVEDINGEGTPNNFDTTGSITSGTTTLTLDAAEAFKELAYGSGRWVEISGAGPGGATLLTRITGFTSATVVTVRDAASTTVASQAVSVKKRVGVEITSTGNAPEVNNISVGDNYLVYDEDGFSGNTGGGRTYGFRAAQEFALIGFEPQTAAIRDDDANEDLWWAPQMSSVVAANNTATDVLSQTLAELTGNVTWQIDVKSTDNALFGRAIVSRLQGANGKAIWTIEAGPDDAGGSETLAFSVNSGAIAITQVSGGSLTFLTRIQRIF